MRQHTPRIALFSLNTFNDLAIFNKANINVRQVLSVNNGKKEWKYIVNVDDELTLNKVIELAMAHKQSNIFLLDEWRRIETLNLSNGLKEEVGHLIPVTEEIAKTKTFYTFDKDLGYFAVFSSH